MSHRTLSQSVFVLLGIAAFVGCSAEGVFSDDPGDPPATDTGAVLPPSSNGGSGGDTQAGGKDGGARKDGGSSVDAGPPPPEPGTACATIDAIFERPCGACGAQQAICLPDGDAGAGKVSDYGACIGEVAGGCIPGVVETDSCGNCGTLTKTCNKYCAWTKTACTGEPASSCPAGTVAWSTTGCPSGLTQRTCSDACQWSSFSGVCSAADFVVRAPSAAGKIASVIFPLRATDRSKKVTGSCANGATVSTTTDHLVAYVRVQNDNAQPAKISVWNAQAPGGSVVDTILTAYARVPTTDDDLRACEKGAGDVCATAKLPCGDSKFGALTDANAVVVPAGGSRVIAVTTKDVYGAGSAVDGPITLSVRTDALE